MLKPGSFSWLVANDLLLAWRGFADVLGRFGERRAPLVLLVAVGLVHIIAWPVARFAGNALDGAATGGEHALILAAGLVSLLLWSTSQALVATTRAIFVRSDLDLLLSSPVPAARVLGARAVAIATSSAGSVALIVLPLAHMGAVQGRTSWLLAWPALAVVSLLGTAAGLMLAVAIFIGFGRRRARLAANLLATAIAGAFVLGIQIWLLLPPSMQAGARAALQAVGTASFERPDGALKLLADAASGSLPHVALMIVGASGLFALAVALLSGPFVQAAMASAGAPATTVRRPSEESALGFRGGAVASLRRKEWRLLARDPSIFSQLGLQIIYTLPVAVVLARGGQNVPTGLALAPTIVVIAGQIAASLAWITVSGEDAQDLVRTAPIRPSAVARAKLGAIVLPVAAVLALPMLALALLDPPVALVTLVTAALAAASTALLNLWHPMPGHRRCMLRRHAQSKLVGLLEHALALLWAVVAVLAIFGSVVTLVPLALVAILLAIAAPRRSGGGSRPRRAWAGLTLRRRSTLPGGSAGP